MSVDFDTVTHLALRIVDARRDQSISGEDFIDLLQRYTRAVARELGADQDEPPAPEARRTSPNCPDCAVPSQEGAGSATGGADSTIAEPASPSLAEGASSAAAPSGGDAGAPPAGSAPLPGAEASQPKQGRMTRHQVAELRAAFDQALRDNEGKLPTGFIARQADATGFSIQAIYARVTTWQRELKATGGMPPRPQPKSEPASSPPRAELVRRELAAREHTNSHSCWCREKPCNTKNPWCSIAKPPKTVGTLAGLSDRPRRAERHFAGK